MSSEGNLIKRAISARFETQRTLADRAGVSLDTVNALVTGRRHVEAKTAAQVAAALDLTPEQLDDAGAPLTADALRVLGTPLTQERMSEVTDGGRLELVDVIDRLTPAERAFMHAMGRELLRLRDTRASAGNVGTQARSETVTGRRGLG